MINLFVVPVVINTKITTPKNPAGKRAYRAKSTIPHAYRTGRAILESMGPNPHKHEILTRLINAGIASLSARTVYARWSKNRNSVNTTV